MAAGPAAQSRQSATRSCCCWRSSQSGTSTAPGAISAGVRGRSECMVVLGVEGVCWVRRSWWTNHSSPVAVAPISPLRVFVPASATVSGWLSPASATVLLGSQWVEARSRRLICAHGWGVSQMTHASTSGAVRRRAGFSQEAASVGQSTVVAMSRPVPCRSTPAHHAALKRSAARRDRGPGPCPTATRSAPIRSSWAIAAQSSRSVGPPSSSAGKPVGGVVIRWEDCCMSGRQSVPGSCRAGWSATSGRSFTRRSFRPGTRRTAGTRPPGRPARR